MSLEPSSIESREIARGAGWSVSRFVCTAGPADAPFEERHDRVSLSLVARGAFEYRTRQGAASLVPGAVLLGNFGHCYRCSHAHGHGDECVSFQFEPDLWGEIVAGVPGARRAEFVQAAHPPDWALAGLITAADRLRPGDDGDAMEEIVLAFAGAILARQSDATAKDAIELDSRKRSRLVAAALAIEAEGEESAGASLAALARGAGMSRYHFLRQFHRLVGLTPHQFRLWHRLRRAATRLVEGTDPIADIAYSAGFGDLSTFNRRFRAVMGVTPGAFRRAGGRVGARSGIAARA